MSEKFGIHPDTGRWNPNLAKQFMPEHVQRILNMYRNASPELMKSGHDWYPRAHEEAKSVGRGNVERGAGILAALSPLTTWTRNRSLARDVIKTGTANVFDSTNLEKAQRILQGEHPLDVLQGHKVTSFYRNIVNPDDPDPVTIDRHAHDIPMGIAFRGVKKSNKPAPDLGLDALGRYQHFVDAYKNASQQLEVPIPNKVQAITWVTHRGTPE